VLELRGQFAFFDSYLISDREPPAALAGTYHFPCLAASGRGARWHAAVLESLVDVRRHTELGRAEGWVAVRSPQGEPFAISPDGALLPLRFRTTPRPVDGGLAAVLHEPEYNLELRDTVVIAKIATTLRTQKSMSLAAVYEAIGIADVLVRPDLQAEAAFLVEDPDSVGEWTTQFISAAVTYTVFVPTAMARYVSSTGNQVQRS
jgi:hypothetical protein